MATSRGKKPTAKDLELLTELEIMKWKARRLAYEESTVEAIRDLEEKDPLVAYVRAVYENIALNRQPNFERDLGHFTRDLHHEIGRKGWHRHIIYKAVSQYTTQLFHSELIQDDIVAVYGSVPDNFLQTIGKMLSKAPSLGIRNTGLHVRGLTIWQPAFSDPDYERYATTLVRWKRKGADDFTAWDLDPNNPRKAGLFIVGNQDILGLRNYYDSDGNLEKVDRMILYGTRTSRYRN